jgi:hypothetical protein
MADHNPARESKRLEESKKKRGGGIRARSESIEPHCEQPDDGAKAATLESLIDSFV